MYVKSFLVNAKKKKKKFASSIAASISSVLMQVVSCSCHTGLRKSPNKCESLLLYAALPPQTGLVGGPRTGSSTCLWSFRRVYSGA